MEMKNLFKKLYEEKYGHKIAKDLAEEIVKDFAVTDNSGRINGEKWAFDEAIHFGEKNGIDFSKVDKVDFYIVLNSMYSDYFKVQKNFGLPDSFYALLAYDFICDVDAPKSKVFDYFMNF